MKQTARVHLTRRGSPIGHLLIERFEPVFLNAGRRKVATFCRSFANAGLRQILVFRESTLKLRPKFLQMQRLLRSGLQVMSNAA